MKYPPSTDVDFPVPRWTLRSLVFAVLATGFLFVLLPLTEQFSPPPEADLSLRELKRVAVPPPLKAPPPQPDQPLTPRDFVVDLPQPTMKDSPPASPSLQIPVDLQPRLGNLQAAYQNSFQIQGDDLALGMASGIFEIADLDQAPQALARVNPLYPPQARMRKIEGYVTVEFIVGVDGSPQDLQVVDSAPGDLFIRSVERAVRGWRFKPGEVGGKAVASRVRQRIDFTLD